MSHTKKGLKQNIYRILSNYKRFISRKETLEVLKEVCSEIKVLIKKEKNSRKIYIFGKEVNKKTFLEKLSSAPYKCNILKKPK